MRGHIRLLFLTASLATVGSVAPAAARDSDRSAVGDTRLYGGLWLGFGGDAEFDGDDQFAGDLDTTLGGQFGVDALLLPHFSLGGEARIGASKWIRAGDRTKLIDLDVKPRLYFPLGRSPLELYFAVPVGITIPRLSDGGSLDAEGRAGWNLGVGGGLNLWLTDGFGLNAEPMWLMHRFKTDASGSPEFTLKQFALFLNAAIAF